MAIEIERKFLIKRIPKDKIEYSHYIKQGYIVSDKHKAIRIRQKKDDFFITIKGNKTGISRFEFEYKIPKNDADQLFKNFCKESIIEKTRHYIKHKGHTWELDVFHGENEGLIVAEIELKSEEETFSLPDWVDYEVTFQEKYYNMNLIKIPFKNWPESLKTQLN
tara:strand:- start:20 stop:511 length:492 start_codon:yes stop_codon:yes gene_type:complete